VKCTSGRIQDDGCGLSNSAQIW